MQPVVDRFGLKKFHSILFTIQSFLHYSSPLINNNFVKLVHDTSILHMLKFQSHV